MSVKLKDVLSHIADYEKYRITEIELKEFLDNNISHKNFLPTIDKGTIADKVYEKIQSYDYKKMVPSMIALEINAYMNFLILMSYGDIVFKETDFKIKIYDKLCVYGISKYILGSCGDDYKAIQGICENMTSFYLLKELGNIFGPETANANKEAFNSMRELLNDKEALKTLRTFAKMDNLTK